MVRVVRSVLINPPRLAALVAPLAAAAVLALPGSAGAATFCVNDAVCSALGGTPKASVSSALGAAESNGQTDLVRIGAKGTAYIEDAMEYQSQERVTIEGAGRDATVLSRSSPGGVLRTWGAPAEIKNLGIRVPDIGNTYGLATNGIVTGVKIVGTGDAPRYAGAAIDDGAVFSNGQISMSKGPGIFVHDGGTPVTVKDAFISAPTGVSVTNNWAPVNLARVRIRASREGVKGAGTATINAENLIVQSTTPTATGILADWNSDVNVSHATIVGAGSETGVVAKAAWDHQIAQLAITDSVISGYVHSMGRSAGAGGIADLAARFSSFRTTGGAVVSSGAGTLDISGNGNVPNVDPQFVATGGWVPNYTPQAGSPLLDAANPQDSVTLDVNRQTRPKDGDGVGGPRSDIGALERDPQAAEPDADPGAEAAADTAADATAGSPGTGDGSGGSDSTAPVVSHLAVTPRFRRGSGLARLVRRGGAIRFRLSEPAAASLTFERVIRRAGRTRYVRVRGAVKASARAGLNRVRFAGRISSRRSLRPGHYRLTVRATDAAGNRSNSRSARFRLLR